MKALRSKLINEALKNSNNAAKMRLFAQDLELPEKDRQKIILEIDGKSYQPTLVPYPHRK